MQLSRVSYQCYTLYGHCHSIHKISFKEIVIIENKWVKGWSYIGEQGKQFTQSSWHWRNIPDSSQVVKLKPFPWWWEGLCKWLLVPLSLLAPPHIKFWFMYFDASHARPLIIIHS
jgi:hypothetical protein